MWSRDDFGVSVKRAVAKRVGDHCSNPDCRALTGGPHVDDSKALNLGVAAHITAASLGGPRFNPNLSQSQRRNAQNAIWLCQNCAKLVDSDVIRFSESLLRRWKREAEADALSKAGKTARKKVGRVFRENEREIARNLALRDQMRSDFLKHPSPFNKWPPLRPYEKFAKSEVIIRSISEYDNYPDLDLERPGISPWFKLEVYDFYHNGLEFIMSIERGILRQDGAWAVIKHNDSFDT